MTTLPRRLDLIPIILCGVLAVFGACGDDNGGGGGGGGDTGTDLPACTVERGNVSWPDHLNNTDTTTRPVRIIVEAVDFENDIVVLRNVSSDTITFDNTWRVYNTIAPVELNGFALAAGARVKVHTIAEGVSDADDFYCGLPTAWAEACGGEMAILHNPNPDQGWYRNPDFIEAALIWGNRYPLSDSATWNDEAVAAGAWTTPYDGSSSNIDVCWLNGVQPTCVVGGSCAANDVGIVATGNVADPGGWTSLDSSQASCLVY